jgi:hypothetical protein
MPDVTRATALPGTFPEFTQAPLARTSSNLVTDRFMAMFSPPAGKKTVGASPHGLNIIQPGHGQVHGDVQH